MLAELNAYWEAASIDEGLIYGQQTYQAALVAGKAVYSIGTSGDLNTSRPQRIYKAQVLGVVAFTATTTSGSAVLTAIPDTSNLFVGQQAIGAGLPANSFILSIVTNTSATLSNAATASATLTGTIYATNGNRNEIRLVAAGEYYDHNDLGASAFTPDELYPDYLTSGANGTMNLYLFPVPRLAPLALELDMAVIFSAWTLGGSQAIPPGYSNWLQWVIARKCLPGFGTAVNPAVAQAVMAEAGPAEANIRKANAINRQMATSEALPPGTAESAALAAVAQGGKGQ